jgi:hypothetical protein
MTTAVTSNARAVTRGSTNGSITRLLMSPGDLGRSLKPFVFRNLFTLKPIAEWLA